MPLPEAIGFPPPLLGDKPQRLPIIVNGPGWFVLDKPAGCLIDAHPWNQDVPSLVAGIRSQNDADKPELAPLDIDIPYATHYLDVEATGIALIASNKDVRGVLKDVIGSAQATFRFQFLARKAPDQEKLSCGLPIGEDAEYPRAAIEHRLGKKSQTSFRRLGQVQGLSLWEATTHFPRPQQIRVHAHVSGFELCGERIFDDVPEVTAGDFNPHLRGSAAHRFVYRGLCLRLVDLTMKVADDSIAISAPPTKPWRAIARRLGVI